MIYDAGVRTLASHVACRALAVDSCTQQCVPTATTKMAHGFEQTHLSYIPGTRLSRTDTKMPSTDDPPPVDTICALPSAATPTTPPLSTCHPPHSRVACVRERAFLHRSTVEKEQKSVKLTQNGVKLTRAVEAKSIRHSQM